MKPGAGLCLALYALAACSPADSSGEPPDVLAATASLTRPAPGLYRTTTQLVHFALPGATPQESDRMRERFWGVEPQVTETCLTPEEAVQGFTGFVEEMQQGDCTLESIAAGETQLRAELTCASADGTQSHITLTGVARRESSHMQSAIVQTRSSIPGGRQEITLSVTNQRLGDCAA